MAESEEELKNLLEKVKEENLKAILKLKIQKLSRVTYTALPYSFGNHSCVSYVCESVSVL